MTGKKENKKYSSYSFDCRDEPAMHNMQNISKIKICRHIISDFVINTTFLIIIWHTINQPRKEPPKQAVGQYKGCFVFIIVI